MSPSDLLQLEPPRVWVDVWRGLARASRDGRHPFRLPTISTRCPNRGVRGRTVVLRDCSPGTARLSFHSDRRAGKLAGLAIDPRVSWCFYDPRRRVQVRAETCAEVHIGDELARAAWDGQSASARRLYAVEPEPGTSLPGGWSLPPAGDPDRGFDNFALVECPVEELEWLVLTREGHRRLHFLETPDGDWWGTALVP